jgi:hypothetical protein
MKGFWVALGSLATLGLLLVGLWSLRPAKRETYPRLTIRSRVFEPSGLKIRNGSTGEFNSTSTGQNGDVVLDPVFAGRQTKIEVYLADEKTLLFTHVLDFTKNRWMCIDYDEIRSNN